MSRRCTKCDQAPSGLIPRAHEFCEHCGGPLEDVYAPVEQVTVGCYRCAKKFEAAKGTTICADCQQVPTAAAASELPAEPQNSFAMAAVWGAALPISVRVAYGMMIGSYVSREDKALVGTIAFFAACLVLGVLGLITGQSAKSPSTAEQFIALAALVVVSAVLWQVT